MYSPRTAQALSTDVAVTVRLQAPYWCIIYPLRDRLGPLVTTYSAGSLTLNLSIDSTDGKSTLGSGSKQFAMWGLVRQTTPEVGRQST